MPSNLWKHTKYLASHGYYKSGAWQDLNRVQKLSPVVHYTLERLIYLLTYCAYLSKFAFQKCIIVTNQEKKWKKVLYLYSSARMTHLQQRIHIVQKSLFRVDKVQCGAVRDSDLPATLTSQARAISRPPPNAAPSMAAIVGTGRFPTVGHKEGAHMTSYISHSRACELICSSQQHSSRLNFPRGKWIKRRVAVNRYLAPWWELLPWTQKVPLHFAASWPSPSGRHLEIMEKQTNKKTKTRYEEAGNFLKGSSKNVGSSTALLWLRYKQHRL